MTETNNESEHENHYVIPAMDTGMTPVKEFEMFCVDCETFYMPE